MFKLLKKAFKKKNQIIKHPVRYDAFGNAIPNVAAKQNATTRKSDVVSIKEQTMRSQHTELVVMDNHNTMALENASKEQHLARALSQQMHYALDKMHHQLTEREMRMEARFEQLGLQSDIGVKGKGKKRLWLSIVGGMLAGVLLVYLLYIMQNMQTSMQAMSGDISGMTNDISQMSVNTKSMSNNMDAMNQGVSGMNQQMEDISASIEPMGETAKSVSPFAKMFNQFSPF